MYMLMCGCLHYIKLSSIGSLHLMHFRRTREMLQPSVLAHKTAKAGTSHDTGSLQISQCAQLQQCLRNSISACGMHGPELFHCLTDNVLQALITNSLQAVLPPNCTFTAVTMIQQLNSDTVIVDAQFQLWESQVAVLLANKCCDLEVLFLQQAVQRIDPTVIGEGCF